MDRKIDVFNHIMPARYFEKFSHVIRDKGMAKRMSSVRLLHDLDGRMRMMDRWSGYQQILTASPPAIELLAGPDASPELARLANDGLYEICERYPGKFPAFVAAIPYNNLDAALQEVERAITQLGARGIQMFTNVNGRPLDEPAFAPIFELMANRYKLPILLHPTRTPGVADYATEQKSKYEIWQVLAWPHDTSVAMARIVFSGMLEKWPSLKIVTHHLGGTAPYLAGRLGPLWDQLGARTSDEDYESLLKNMSKRPIAYFQMFFGDTVVGGSTSALRCGVEFFGPERVLFASDCPFDPEGGPMFIRENMRAVEELDISDTERQRIFSQNAIEMFMLSPATSP
jgi:predicted TIM-barrel fold metal-dependent hydrolase